MFNFVVERTFQLMLTMICTDVPILLLQAVGKVHVKVSVCLVYNIEVRKEQNALNAILCWCNTLRSCVPYV